MFEAARGRVTFDFLEYRAPEREHLVQTTYGPYGRAHHWDEFRSAQDVLERLKPQRIFLMATTSLNQMVLLNAARQRGIRTYHLEHGYRFQSTDGSEVDEFLSKGTRSPAELIRRLRTAFRNLRGHRFFLQSLTGLERRKATALLRYAVNYYRHGESFVALQRQAALRRPDEYVAFSPATLAFHSRQDEIPPSTQVRFVGIPYFDALTTLPNAQVDERAVMLIDHQLHEASAFGWNSAFRHEWVDRIADIVQRRRMRLAVKLHPEDRSNAWRRHLGSSVRLIDYADLPLAAASSRFVMGAFSTMLLPLLALPHTVGILLDIHPRREARPGSDFSEAGVAASATTFEDLEAFLDDGPRLLAQQQPKKKAFEERNLFRFDGRSGQRLADILVNG